MTQDPRRDVPQDDDAADKTADDTAADTAGDTADDTADDAPPPVPPEIREAALLAPGSWLGLMDPAWSGEGDPPPWAMVGQWRSGPNGEVDEWLANPDHRPSPHSLGWPEPTDDIDRAVQLAATGYGPGDDVTVLLAAAEEVAVLTRFDGAPVSATASDGTPVVPLYTSPAQLELAGRFGYEVMSVRHLTRLLPEGHGLYLNASGPVSMTVEPDALRAALDRMAAADAEQPAQADSEEATETPRAVAAEADDDSPEQPTDLYDTFRPATMSGPEASMEGEEATRKETGGQTSVAMGGDA
ncbi:type VII secretion system-associated protein [Streptomyces sp. NPDC006654]|uniref:type VII secretion system-associated protein n=1 Tax=Streptomyces sp. NPDC006654 TaxID=3156897 RepID=UPI003407BDDB